MKIVIAPDSFKGSASALAAAQSIETGIKRCLPHAETVLVPVADGGEGTMDSLVAATKGKKVEVDVTGPLGRPVKAEYGILGDGVTCVIEMASASGIILVPSDQLDPLTATTYGTGELIKQALNDGCRHFLLAVGGSATNDGGIGMLQALGLNLLDADGQQVGFGGDEMDRIIEIDDSDWDARLAESTFTIASDVQNPMTGPDGATYVFGPQKGATPELVERLEEKMDHWATLVETKTGIGLHELPGAGAAGGIGGAFLAFLSAEMKRGIDIVIEYTGLPQKLQGAELVFTGEGMVDYQTASGKVPMGIAQEASKQGIPSIVLAGSIGEGIDILYQYGIQSIHSIVSGPMTLKEAMDNAEHLLANRAEQVMRTYMAGKTSL